MGRAGPFRIFPPVKRIVLLGKGVALRHFERSENYCPNCSSHFVGQRRCLLLSAGFTYQICGGSKMEDSLQ